jgi:D-alanyl-D-alanine carboxypeptidase/D-alanyl-D-alanine-endopeptidase (penicillin-binding protein 4)
MAAGIARTSIARRRTRVISLAVWAFLTITLPVWAASAGMVDKINKLLSDLPNKNTKCSGLVVDLSSDAPLAAIHDEDLLMPASNQKVLVLATAVDALGPDAVFRTVLGVRGNDLVVIGDGDPTLGDPEVASDHGVQPLAFIDEWANALKAAGRASITGDMIVDATIFDEEFVHPDWDTNDLLKWYGAPVGGLNLSNNCLTVDVWPAKGGGPAEYTVVPPCPAAKVTNRCTSSAGAKKANPVVTRRDGFELVLSGQVGKKLKLGPVAVPNPNVFAASAIRALLEQRGVKVAGALRFARVRDAGGNVPNDVTVVAQKITPIADALHRIGQDSQNMCAESMLKRVGYEWAKKQGNKQAVGSWETGRQAVRAMLAKAGCSASNAVVTDGSGLSRTNRICANDLVKVLRYMHQHPSSEVFMTSLAGNRTGGTLKKRMDGVDGDVFAKTGYMKGIRALTGYVHSKDDRWYAFSILFNGFSGGSQPYSKIQQQVCQLLATNGAKATP